MKTLLLIVICALNVFQAQAEQGPSFDCSKKLGTVESLVCKDAELSALDRKLSDLYKAALGKTSGRELTNLKLEQIGWVKGRDDCWKGQDMRECAKGNYIDRIVELQATYRLVKNSPAERFQCDDGSKIVATSFETDPQTVWLERGDQKILAIYSPDVDNPGYYGMNVKFWRKEDQARVEWYDTVARKNQNFQCKIAR